MRDATELKLGVEEWMEFLLTRPMRDATHVLADDISYNRISTHAPHAGRDETVEEIFVNIAISTHAPHAGRDGFCCR